MRHFLFLLVLVLSGCKFWKPPTNGEWMATLPPCPCEMPKVESTDDGWGLDIGNLKKSHPGATHCFRSYLITKTTEGKSGQQCCYDAEDKLITSGPGRHTRPGQPL